MLHPAQLSLQYAVALQALTNLQPATQQVHVYRIEAIDASPHSPVEVAPEVDDSSRASRPQAVLVEGGGHQAADTMRPAVVQVQVCSVELMDTASNLPVENVTSEDTMQPAVVQASRPQVALVEGGGLWAELKEVADHQAADTRRPAVAQVHVCSIDSVDAPPHLPVGSSSEASRPQAAVVEGGGHHAEAQEAAGHQAADTM